MPASANCPDSTLISPILTVPCACADGAPNSSATAQPSPRTLRSIAHPPGLFCRRPFVAKSVLTKNYAVESILSGSLRELSAAQPVLGERPLGWSANMAVRLPRQRRRSHGGARRRVVAAHHRGTREPRTAARMHPPAPSTAALPPPTAPGKCRAEIP